MIKKTSNFYKVFGEQYEKSSNRVLVKEIQKSYKQYEKYKSPVLLQHARGVYDFYKYKGGKRSFQSIIKGGRKKI